MPECVRCRQQLHDETQSRYNATFGGLAHWACPGRAVWPPAGGAQQREYDPMIALRKMAMKEAFAGTEAQQHIQALSS